MLWGVVGARLSQISPMKFCCGFRRTKLSQFFLKLCCEAGLAKIIASLVLKNVMGGCGGKTLADFPHEVLLWFLKDKTIADFFLKLCCEAALAKIMASFLLKNVMGGLWWQDYRSFSP